MNRYSVDTQSDEHAVQSSVVEADTTLEAELAVIDHPEEHIHGYNGEDFQIVDVREIYSE